MLGCTSRQCCGSQISGPNWSLCRDIESSIVTESSVFVASFCRNLQFSFATYSLSFFLDYVATNFDNIVTEFLSRRLVLVMTGFVMSRHKIVAPGSSYTSALRKCSDIIFFVATCLFLFSLSTLSQYSFLCRDRISLIP